MTDNKEGQPTNLPPEDKDIEKLFRWGEILYQQAYSLLGKYLPEAQPQEPTDIWIGGIPGYRAKYKGIHRIAGLPNFKASKAMEQLIEQMGHVNDKDWIQPLSETEDWDEPERLTRGVHQFSLDSWRGISIVVHELIHQKQAELHPDSFPVLSDSEEIPKEDIENRIIDTHEAWSRSIGGSSSLFIPVIEGMAALGTYYVMGRFLDDLIKAGDTTLVGKIRKVRNEAIHLEVRKPKPDVTNLFPYHPYSEGIGIMRKLYKRFGIENTPKILAAVDLKACQSISKGSTQYQQMMENPVLLPGLEKAARL